MMTYVPIVPHTQVPPLSPRTRELGDLLAKVVDEYTNAHPATTKAEVQAAFRLARMSRGSDSASAVIVASLAVGLGVAMLLGGLFYFRAAGEVEIGPILPMIILVAVVLIGIVAVIKARSG